MTVRALPAHSCVVLTSLIGGRKLCRTGRAPQTVKLFVNTRDMDFQSVDSAPATQVIELKADDVKGDKLVPLRYHPDLPPFLFVCSQ